MCVCASVRVIVSVCVCVCVCVHVRLCVRIYPDVQRQTPNIQPACLPTQVQIARFRQWSDLLQARLLRWQDMSCKVECPICMERPNDCAMQCGHRSCKDCLLALPVPKCPMCQAPFVTAELVLLF